jgi:hypothetical protein
MTHKEKLKNEFLKAIGFYSENGKKGGNTNKESGHMSNLGKQWGAVNGRTPNARRVASEMGKKYGKLNMEKYMTAEDKLRGAKKAGKNNVESGHWANYIKMGTKASIESRQQRKKEKIKSILNLIEKDVFQLKDIREACKIFGVKDYTNYAKLIAKNNEFVEQISKGYNQFNPSLYKKIIK